MTRIRIAIIPSMSARQRERCNKSKRNLSPHCSSLSTKLFRGKTPSLSYSTSYGTRVETDRASDYFGRRSRNPWGQDAHELVPYNTVRPTVGPHGRDSPLPAPLAPSPPHLSPPRPAAALRVRTLAHTHTHTRRDTPGATRLTSHPRLTASTARIAPRRAPSCYSRPPCSAWPAQINVQPGHSTRRRSAPSRSQSTYGARRSRRDDGLLLAVADQCRGAAVQVAKHLAQLLGLPLLRLQQESLKVGLHALPVRGREAVAWTNSTKTRTALRWSIIV